METIAWEMCENGIKVKKEWHSDYIVAQVIHSNYSKQTHSVMH